MMENNKEQELPQLRSETSMELGCDPHGYSRAGYDTTIWYCAIALGRPSMELNRLREVCTLYCFKPNSDDREVSILCKFDATPELENREVSLDTDESYKSRTQLLLITLFNAPVLQVFGSPNDAKKLEFLFYN
ncbi:unnamed protein product [Lathyrus sativus]|nr:unnamed protein product [Lathyrus sativus]